MIGLWIPADFNNIIDTFEHLKTHKELYWTIGNGIKDREKLSLPLVGLLYLNNKGDIKCQCKINKILPFSLEHYKDTRKKPTRWINEMKRKKRHVLTLVMTKIEPFYYETKKLKNSAGNNFKPSEKCIKILLPSRGV